MAIIQAETYAKFKPIFLDALKTRTEPGADRKEMMHAIISQLKDASYTREDAEDIRPYIELFLEVNFVPVPGHWGTLPLSVKGAPNGTTATEVHRRL